MNLINENDIIIDSDTGEMFFDLNSLPKSIQLNKSTFINNCRQFIESHLAYVNTYKKSSAQQKDCDCILCIGTQARPLAKLTNSAEIEKIPSCD
jgi:hypothetical protein